MVLLNLENSNVKKNRHTEEQIIGILREAEVPGAEIRAVVRKHNITEQTF
jgi:putative transposase